MIMPRTRQNHLMLAERTLQLVDTASESGDEAAAARLVREAVPLDLRWERGETLLYSSGRTGKPVLVLAGHLDTVPPQGNIPGRIEDGAVHGLGAADMKSGVAVMIELARWIADARPELSVDVDFLFFPLEEVAVELSPLPELFESGLVADADLVVVLEPTDNQIHAGCVGNLNATLTFHGESAHSARPWTGVNAIRLAVEGLGEVVGLQPLDVESGGLLFREVLSVTRLESGIAANVIPAEAVATLNYRYAPGRTRAEAEARLRELVDGAGELAILSNAPAADVNLDAPLLRRLIELGGLEVEPKQAWTPVAQFSELGLVAVNFGPGAPRYAHKRDELVEIASLERSFDVLRRFIS
jgi:succinyl-diaminopimelate desuccinylase